MTPLLRRIVAIYAVLAIGVFAFPGGLVAWLDDHNRSGRLDAPLALARAIDAASTAVGVKPVGQRLRKAFAAAIGDDEG
ncbi:MAG: hypothetical protein KGM15_14380 [Pseudomonadota bacterium]|nr:hypothetical protein [Pseudomonadota bacterium]